MAIRPDSKNFGPEAEKEVSAGLTQVVSSGAKILGGLAVGQKIKQTFTEGLDELKQAAEVQAQTTAGIASTGGAAQVTAQHVQDLAGSIEDLAGFDDEAVQQGENLLLTFTNIRNEAGAGNDVFDRTTQSLADVAARMGGDVSGAAVQLGKAINDPIAGLAALTRIGITFTDQQKEQVKALQQGGDLLGAQKIVLDELNKEFGGSAKALGDSLPGALNKAKEASANAKGELVEGLTPAILLEAKAQQFMADTLLALPEPLRAVLGGVGLLAGGLGSILVPAKAALDLFHAIHPAQVAAAGSAAELAVAEGAAGAAAVGGTAGIAGMAVAEDAVAVNSALAVEGLYATEAATLSLEAAFPPLLIAAAAVTAALAIFGTGGGDIVPAVKGLDQEVQQLTSDFADLSTTAGDDLAKNIATVVKGDEDLAGAFAAGGITVDQFAKALAAGGSAFHDLIGPLRESGQLSESNTLRLAVLAKGQEDAAQAALDQALAQGEVNQQQVDAAVAANTAADGTINYIGAVDDLASSSDTLSTSQQGVQQTAEEAAKALADQKQAADDLQAAYQGLIDQTLGAFNAAIHLSDAQISSRKAQDELVAAIKAGNDGTRTQQEQQDLLTSKTNDAFAAILAEAKANEDLQKAQVESVGGTFSAADAQKSLLDELESVASSLDPNSPLVLQLLGYITTLQQVPSNVPTAVHADTAEATQAVIDFQRQLAGIPPGVDVAMTVFTSVDQDGHVVRRMAAGSLVRATPGGVMANVAEAGKDEAVIPLPPGLLDALASIGSGGGSVGAGSGGPTIVLQNATERGARANAYEIQRVWRQEEYRRRGGR